MADNISNPGNFEIDVILGDLDIDNTDASEIKRVGEDVLDNIHEECILTEFPTMLQILFIDEDDISKVHFDKKKSVKHEEES